ncbi:precorrin-3b c17-methyltransferase, putative [Heliomicrobium modesticaldum Ice1]|uniref:Precorrin-3b c17-methyltransferase, putative n=1 Tax=Heliobacterium modesticaldum (strain ATCC 51547 / Ice1) TaxID=498761 RepID=B0TIJ9_HELMI|nr:cobalamin biosynthesis protein [Heliomicrobium modesticaldum]ABZ84940.1 precorrin-3b c17-methyltransferase, putative [Heliomicrobium modesticaldum Ice1]
MNVLALTPGGSALARRIGNVFPEARLWLPVGGDEGIDAGAGDTDAHGAGIIDATTTNDTAEATVLRWRPPLRNTFGLIFSAGKPILFIGALGILVRLLAPRIADKRTDPPVIALDEGGRFVISVLAGHWGGANELAKEVSRRIGAVPVITTATDVAGLPAVDTFARRWGARIEPWAAVKKIASAQLRGDAIKWLADERFLPVLKKLEPAFPWHPSQKPTREPLWKQPASGMSPSGDQISGALTSDEASLCELNQKTKTQRVLFSSRWVEPPVDLRLFPRCLIAGIGCRRGVSLEQVHVAFREACQIVDIHPRCLTAIASAWVKAEEPALIALAKTYDVPFRTFSADEIQACCASHREIGGSLFVADAIGVKAVCEPTALLTHPQARLLLKKRAAGPVTVALAEVPWPSSDWDQATGIR